MCLLEVKVEGGIIFLSLAISVGKAGSAYYSAHYQLITPPYRNSLLLLLDVTKSVSGKGWLVYYIYIRWFSVVFGGGIMFRLKNMRKKRRVADTSLLVDSLLWVVQDKVDRWMGCCRRTTDFLESTHFSTTYVIKIDRRKQVVHTHEICMWSRNATTTNFPLKLSTDLAWQNGRGVCYTEEKGERSTFLYYFPQGSF